MAKKTKKIRKTKLDELASIIQKRIESLRPKLLDLTRRNPLLSTKFSDRSNSHIRIVDELPQSLFDKLINSKMQFSSLPPLEADPKDEGSEAFQNMLADARITDKEYNKNLEDIDQDSDDSADQLALAERSLKDRLRDSLGMPQRQKNKQNVSLSQHAKNNDILPSYELLLPRNEHEDGRHRDKFLQTLLLPDMMERKLNALLNKNRTWAQETGIVVLKAAFGFLEWTESSTSKKSLAPLVLLSVEIEKIKTEEGYEYWISCKGDSAEINTVLAKKLSIDYGMVLPKFNLEKGDIEAYFKKMIKICLKEPSWRIRRQVAIGVFPSARMAMYHDLDTKNGNFHEHDIIKKLLGGGGASGIDAPFAEDYNIDNPKIEIKTPLIVTEADSSQHSALIDIADNKNIAVEGPPGTGKSQTIVNAIAVALSQGKKVLFVAEKMAALEVVRSRLEACGLGDFLLTLQAKRSTKEQVIKSIRARIKMKKIKDPEDLSKKIIAFKTARAKIGKYVRIISSKFLDTEFSVYDILGWGLVGRKSLEKIKFQKEDLGLPDIRNISKEKLQAILQVCKNIECHWKKTIKLPQFWSIIKRKSVDPYVASKILKEAKECSRLYEKSEEVRKNLTQISLSSAADKDSLSALKNAIGEIITINKDLDVSFIDCVIKNNLLEKLKLFFVESMSILKVKEELSKYFSDTLSSEIVVGLQEIMKLLSVLGIDVFSEDEFDRQANLIRKEADDKNSVKKLIKETEAVIEDVGSYRFDKIVEFLDTVASTSKKILDLRSRKLSISTNREIILDADKKQKALHDKHRIIERDFCEIKTIQVERVENALNVFINAGFLSFFKPTYQKAKKFYLSIAHNKTFNEENAIRQLRKIKNWINGAHQFCSNVKIKDLIGDGFDGLITDFSPYVCLIEFYERVGKNFKGAEYSNLRLLLKESDSDLLFDLPEVCKDHHIRKMTANTYADLIKNIESLGIRMRLFESEEARIKSYSIAFSGITGVSCEQLSIILEKVIIFQDGWRRLKSNATANRVFGDKFFGPMKLPDSLNISFELCEKLLLMKDSQRSLVLKLLRNDELNSSFEIIENVLNNDAQSEKSLSNVSKLVNVNLDDIFSSLSRKDISKVLLEASKDEAGLVAFSHFYSSKLELSSMGYGKVIDILANSCLDFKELYQIIYSLIGQSLSEEVFKQYGSELSSFNGIQLNQLRSRLAKLDKEILNLSRQRLSAQLRLKARPLPGKKSGLRGEWTNMALLNHEITKKTRFVPVRALTKRAGDALIEIKPCWMMSPLAVAQYIEKNEMSFDLLIIDEASQMTPEDALGAIVRSKQVMIAGDTNQLPPSSFFKKYVGIDEEDEEELCEESILELANFVFRPSRRLRWHYRSRHPDLIAFSNNYVYDNDLTVFPSPDVQNRKQGVYFHKVNGLYSNGTNPIEASFLADAAIDFMHKHKEMSLGIVLLNQRQRDLVMDELNFKIAQDSVAREYIEYWETHNDSLEYFFIKNLENVQGDERDAIFIGTVYGPEKENAPVMQRFGPINGINGKRRLNVLFSRAKHKIVTFSSMTANDIKVCNKSNEGVELLKYWLEYSKTGKMLSSRATRREPDSEFERYVIAELKAMGCEAIPQVGATGYFIDIGVKHPKWPYGFILGVECDGAMYHSAKSARDRDRLRQEVLEGLGWRLYRIWSTDWFSNHLEEIEKLRTVIKLRLKELSEEIERKS